MKVLMNIILESKIDKAKLEKTFGTNDLNIIQQRLLENSKDIEKSLVDTYGVMKAKVNKVELKG